MSTGEHDATLRRFEARTETEETAQYVLTLIRETADRLPPSAGVGYRTDVTA